MVVPVYSYGQFPPQAQSHIGGDGSLRNPLYYLLQQLFKRTGGNSGIPNTVHNNILSTGTTPAILTEDFNLINDGSGGVQLFNLQPGQQQTVFNNDGANPLLVYPPNGGQINGLGANQPYQMAAGSVQIFDAISSSPLQLSTVLGSLGGNGSLSVTVGLNVASAGTTQDTATPLNNAGYSQVTTGGGGVRLDPFSVGQTQIVFNDSNQAVFVYPQASSNINNLAAAAPYVLLPGATQIFFYLTSTQIFTELPQQAAVINILWFGADPTGTNDNTTALTNAYNAVTGSGGTLYFPAGTYLFTQSISFTYPSSNALFDLTLAGDGPDATVLSWSTGGMTINLNCNSTTNNNQSFHGRDLTFATMQTGTGTGLTLNQQSNNNGNYAAVTELTRVTFRGGTDYSGTNYWNTCIAIKGISNVGLTGCYFEGGSSRQGTGVNFTGINSSNIAVVLNCYNTTFNLLNIGFNHGDFVQGVTFSGCNFDCLSAIVVPSGLSAIGAQCCVVNCQFAQNVTGNCIAVQTALNALMVTNSLFILAPGGGSITTGGIVTNVLSNTIIRGNLFQTPVSQSNATAISLQNSASNTGCVISDNIFTGFNGTGSASITVASTCKDVIIDNNKIVVSNQVVNGSTSGTSIVKKLNNRVGANAYVIGNRNGSAGDHGVVIPSGASGGTSDTSTNILTFANGDESANVGGINRNGATGIQVSTVNSITGDGTNITILENDLSTNFAMGIFNNTNTSGAHGLVIRAGLNATTDNGTVMVEFATGNGSATIGSITRSSTGVQLNGVAQTTGAGVPAFSNNSPAVTPGSVYTWLKFQSADGSNVFVPCWK